MRFQNAFDKSPCAPEDIQDYKSAEKLFSLRFGRRALYLTRFFSVKVLPYAQLSAACLETEFVECRTSEFPAEYDLYRLYFYKDEAQAVTHSVDSRVKAQRILERLAQTAPQVRILPERETAAKR